MQNYNDDVSVYSSSSSSSSSSANNHTISENSMSFRVGAHDMFAYWWLMNIESSERKDMKLPQFIDSSSFYFNVVLFRERSKSAEYTDDKIESIWLIHGDDEIRMGMYTRAYRTYWQIMSAIETFDVKNASISLATGTSDYDPFYGLYLVGAELGLDPLFVYTLLIQLEYDDIDDRNNLGNVRNLCRSFLGLINCDAVELFMFFLQSAILRPTDLICVKNGSSGDHGSSSSSTGGSDIYPKVYSKSDDQANDHANMFIDEYDTEHLDKMIHEFLEGSQLVFDDLDHTFDRTRPYVDDGLSFIREIDWVIDLFCRSVVPKLHHILDKAELQLTESDNDLSLEPLFLTKLQHEVNVIMLKKNIAERQSFVNKTTYIGSDEYEEMIDEVNSKPIELILNWCVMLIYISSDPIRVQLVLNQRLFEKTGDMRKQIVLAFCERIAATKQFVTCEYWRPIFEARRECGYDTFIDKMTNLVANMKNSKSKMSLMDVDPIILSTQKMICANWCENVEQKLANSTQNNGSLRHRLSLVRSKMISPDGNDIRFNTMNDMLSVFGWSASFMKYRVDARVEELFCETTELHVFDSYMAKAMSYSRRGLVRTVINNMNFIDRECTHEKEKATSSVVTLTCNGYTWLVLWTSQKIRCYIPFETKSQCMTVYNGLLRKPGNSDLLSSLTIPYYVRSRGLLTNNVDDVKLYPCSCRGCDSSYDNLTKIHLTTGESSGDDNQLNEIKMILCGQADDTSCVSKSQSIRSDQAKMLFELLRNTQKKKFKKIVSYVKPILGQICDDLIESIVDSDASNSDKALQADVLGVVNWLEEVLGRQASISQTAAAKSTSIKKSIGVKELSQKKGYDNIIALAYIDLMNDFCYMRSLWSVIVIKRFMKKYVLGRPCRPFVYDTTAVKLLEGVYDKCQEQTEAAEYIMNNMYNDLERQLQIQMRTRMIYELVKQEVIEFGDWPGDAKSDVGTLAWRGGFNYLCEYACQFDEHSIEMIGIEKYEMYQKYHNSNAVLATGSSVITADELDWSSSSSSKEKRSGLICRRLADPELQDLLWDCLYTCSTRQFIVDKLDILTKYIGELMNWLELQDAIEYQRWEHVEDTENIGAKTIAINLNIMLAVTRMQKALNVLTEQRQQQNTLCEIFDTLIVGFFWTGSDNMELSLVEFIRQRQIGVGGLSFGEDDARKDIVDNVLTRIFDLVEDMVLLQMLPYVLQGPYGRKYDGPTNLDGNVVARHLGKLKLQIQPATNSFVRYHMICEMMGYKNHAFANRKLHNTQLKILGKLHNPGYHLHQTMLKKKSSDDKIDVDYEKWLLKAITSTRYKTILGRLFEFEEYL